MALLPFGAHKGYGLGLIDELYGALIGGSLPTARGHYETKDDEKHTRHSFQCIRPEAISGAFAKGRTQSENVKASSTISSDTATRSACFPGNLKLKPQR